MIEYTEGNLLEADVEAVVNTVNSVGVMGKGIALMFKEAHPANFAAYKAACDAGNLTIGKMFVTERLELVGPRWIINFPTKKHWRGNTRIEWIEEGLVDLRNVIRSHSISSIAVPPLGCGNGGLDWEEVRPLIHEALSDLSARVIVYEPARRYQNVVKKVGVEKVTPARAMIYAAVRQYCSAGVECSILEVQKLAWFLERTLGKKSADNPLGLNFSANKYGPYSDRLRHLLDSMDGSFLKCEKRLADADPLDSIWFRSSKAAVVEAYLGTTEARRYSSAVKEVTCLIDGFESPMGMELLSTVDWLLKEGGCDPSVEDVLRGLRRWPAGGAAAKRKLAIFDERMIKIALERLATEASLQA